MTDTERDTRTRNIGVTFNGLGEAEIILWAPGKERVSLVIDTYTSIPLIQEEHGYWRLNTYELKPGDRYRFLVDDNLIPDPASLHQPMGVHGSSEAIDLSSFKWTDQKWHNYKLKDYIIYELHPGTFTPEGTLEAIEKKLDHLLDLGITAIELMPLAQFAGTRNWGYDGVFPFAVQSSYGGPEALQKLVNACHRKNLAVILDVVYNHIGPEGNYLGVSAPFFTKKYQTPWGDAINFDDAGSHGVKHFFAENALMWLRDFHIDALRLDAVHAIRDFSTEHILAYLRKCADTLMEETGRTHYLIAECDLNDPRFIAPADKGGYGMDAQWNDEFHHALRVTAGQERNGYYADFSGIAHLAKAYTDAYVYNGQFSEQRQRHFGAPVSNNPGEQFIVFSQNHDQVGNRMLGERTSALVSFEMQKLMATAVMVSPYIPLLFMGEEWGEPNPFMYFANPGNKELEEAIRKGRKEEFKHFHTGEDAPDPIDEATFLGSKLQWELSEKDPHRTMFAFYKELIAIRKKVSVIGTPERNGLEVTFDEICRTLLLHRWDHEQHVQCLMNFSDQPQSLTLLPVQKQWKNIFDTADPKWNGPQPSSPLVASGETIILQPESAVIYTSCYV